MMKRTTLVVILAVCSLIAPGHSQEMRAILRVEPEDLKALRDRPLFSPSRRPSVLPGSAPVTLRAQAAPFALVGVIRDRAGTGLAVLVSASGEIIRLAQGEEHDAWTLTELGSRRAVLRAGEAMLELALPDPAQGQPDKAEPSVSKPPASSQDGAPMMYPAPLVKMP